MTPLWSRRSGVRRRGFLGSGVGGGAEAEEREQVGVEEEVEGDHAFVVALDHVDRPRLERTVGTARAVLAEAPQPVGPDRHELRSLALDAGAEHPGLDLLRADE